MHTVDRGPEPPGLAAIRKRLTPRWVEYYRHRRGQKPTDDKWRGFKVALRTVFSDLCGYCEERSDDIVDHFRPKCRFPEKVYAWDNWVLTCHRCNNAKIANWPAGGYVDPCAKTPLQQPESFFEFDTKTGELNPRRGMKVRRYRKAKQTIDDLKLSTYHRCKRRAQHLEFLTLVFAGLLPNDPKAKALARHVASRASYLSSISRVWLTENGFASGFA